MICLLISLVGSDRDFSSAEAWQALRWLYLVDPVKAREVFELLESGYEQLKIKLRELSEAGKLNIRWGAFVADVREWMLERNA